MNKKVIIFHGEVPPGAPPDEQDVLDEAAFVAEGLSGLGYDVLVLPFLFSIDKTIQEIYRIKPEFIFNLVETMDGDGRLVYIAPAIFDHLLLRYTGCSTQANYITSNKMLSKNLMRLNGIPTAGAVSLLGAIPEGEKKYIIKSLWEHASVGLDEHAPALLATSSEIKDRLNAHNLKGKEFFAEEYIHGREFNISMLQSGKIAEVLPLAEIKFHDYPGDKPRIVGYRAKWDTESFEYKHTVREFVDMEAESKLCSKLKEICLQCWDVFGLAGYVRVDFRVDDYGNPFVLEINTNPCISPDGGFIAAAHKAGYTAGQVIERIVEAALA
jgi:D-alanine-D-alanine ligase